MGILKKDKETNAWADDLVEKYQNDEKLKSDIKKFFDERPQPNNHPTIKVGDTVRFMAGYNGDIQFTSQVTATNGNDIYVLWDCYWVNINTTCPKRKVKKIEQ
jgi:hypothetical protein